MAFKIMSPLLTGSKSLTVAFTSCLSCKNNSVSAYLTKDGFVIRSVINVRFASLVMRLAIGEYRQPEGFLNVKLVSIFFER